MVWLKPTLLKLIKLFEEQPHLWKTGHPQYENEELKEAAYSEIASNLGVKPEEVPIKWVQLKSQFNEENSKVVNSQGTYQSHWFGFESMAFLKENEILLEAQSPVICRSCMAEDEKMYDVFSTLIDESVSVASLLDILTGIEISRSDNISKSICKECFIWLEEFYKFRTRANEVQILLSSQPSMESEKKSIIINIPIEEISEETIPFEEMNDDNIENEQIIIVKSTLNKVENLNTFKTNEDQYSCKMCPKTFSKQDKLNIHMFIHKNKHSCKVCGMKLATRESLKSHQLIHSGEKPFVCEICNKAFRQVTTLKFHMKIHTGKDFPCPHCEQLYARWTDLRLHIQRNHSGNQPTYSCKECGKTYTNQTGLKRHMDVVHRGLRQVCDICGKVITTKKNLIVHKATHLDILPFACSFCSKGFLRPYMLKQHIKIHHPTMHNVKV